MLTYNHLDGIVCKETSHKLLLCIQDASKAKNTEDVVDCRQVEEEVQSLAVGQRSCIHLTHSGAAIVIDTIGARCACAQ